MVRRAVKRGVARYSVLIVGLGAAGVAIGWLCHDLPAPVLRRARSVSLDVRRLRGRVRPSSWSIQETGPRQRS
ncbi:hypothetical protein GCM10009780_32060 [Actinomadura alba]